MSDTVDRRHRKDSDAMAAKLPDGDPWTAEIRSRIARLASECGCTMGGIFLAAAMAAAVAYFVITAALDFGSMLLAIGFVFGASVVGKFVGLGVARIRLLLLRRALSARRTSIEATHVHMH